MKLERGTKTVQSTKLPSGLTVVTADAASAAQGNLATVSLCVQAGARNETYNNIGVNQAIRLCAGLGTERFSNFGIVKNIEQAGANVTVTGDRETTTYTQQVLDGHLENIIEYFFNVVCKPKFNTHEIKFLAEQMVLERKALGGGVMANELLHRAAFRDGLGNPLFAPERMDGKIGHQLLKETHQKLYTANRSILVGVGVAHDKLVHLGQLVDLQAGTGPSAPAKYHGGEARVDTGGNLAYVALAAEGSAGAKERAAETVLQRILGVGSKLKYGAGAGKLSQAVGEAPALAAGINYVYSDASLLGAFVACEADAAGQVVGKVAAALRSLSVSEAEVQAAKRAMVLETQEASMSSTVRAAQLASATLAGGAEGAEVDSLINAIQGVSVADVQAAAKKLSNGKLSMGAYGNLSTVPHLDAL